MYNFPIGVMLESFRKEPREAIELARSIGAQGLQAYASRGPLDCRKITPAQTREFLAMVEDNGLKFSALCGDFGHGFGDEASNPALIEDSKRVMDLALELKTNVVTTHIGVVPTDPAHPRYKIMQDACGKLAEYADSVGAHFAIETGPEPADVLKGFLDSLGSRGVAVNMDPANLVMVVGDDPVKAVHTLKDYIVHTHAKDGRMIYARDPEVVYGITNSDDVPVGPSHLEVPLGEGQVPFPEYLAALDEIGFKGFLTIEREVGEDPVGDISRAVEFLRSVIK